MLMPDIFSKTQLVFQRCWAVPLFRSALSVAFFFLQNGLPVNQQHASAQKKTQLGVFSAGENGLGWMGASNVKTSYTTACGRTS